MELVPKGEYRSFYVCHYCKVPENRTHTLQRCGGCQLVAYCSKDCQKYDWHFHKHVCKEFPIVDGYNALYTTEPWEEHIACLRKRAAQLPIHEDKVDPIFRDPRVCNTCRNPHPDKLTNCKCTCVCYCSTKCENDDKLHKDDCSYLQSKSLAFSLVNMRNAYPMSLRFALESYTDYAANYLYKFTKLDIHVVISRPYFDATIWETLFHEFPKLKELNMVFIIQGKDINPHISHSKKPVQLICDDCKSKNLIITSAVHQKPYHMFFSSSEYTAPDIVVLFGLSSKMSDINSEISYRNMIYSQEAVIVLMDATIELVVQGLETIADARIIGTPIQGNGWSKPQRNAFKGFGSIHGLKRSGLPVEMVYDPNAVNEKLYYACLGRKL